VKTAGRNGPSIREGNVQQMVSSGRSSIFPSSFLLDVGYCQLKENCRDYRREKKGKVVTLPIRTNLRIEEHDKESFSLRR
jgi:hypothetical protein